MNIDEMPAGRELDALVALRVMGWTEVTDALGGLGMPPKGDTMHEVATTHGIKSSIPKYSTDIADAWEIVTQMEARFSLDTSLAITTGSFWCARFEDCGDGTWQDEVVVRVAAPTAPLAICQAALKFVEAREARETNNEH